MRRFTQAALLSALVVAALYSARICSAETWSVEAATRLDELLRYEESKDADAKVKPLRRVDDYGFLRRAYLDIVGRIPPYEAIDEFVSSRDPQKRRKLVSALLEEPDFGQHWANYWRDVIMYRRTEDRALLAQQALLEKLSQSFNDNEPWDEIARSFVTASGDVRENGATAIIAAQGGKPEESVAELARVFLGIQIQCAQCHDHPWDRWSREQFHELAAFYPRTYIRPQKKGPERTFVVDARERKMWRRPKLDRHLGKLEHYMPDLDDPAAQGTLMKPVFFLTGDQVPLGTSDDERRQSLAEWMTGDEWFARAFVNRIWEELVGNGFFERMDDLGPDRDPIYPETLDYLTTEFIESGYDIKWLFRTITSTDVYDRQSKTRNDSNDELLMAPLPQRMRATQILSSLIEFASFGQPEVQNRLKMLTRRGPRFVFERTFGYDPSEAREEITGSVPQALLLMNGQALNRLVSARRRDGGLFRLIEETPDDKQLVDELYLRALTRLPNRREFKAVIGHLKSSESRIQAYEDLVWALINSSEFIHRS